MIRSRRERSIETDVDGDIVNNNPFMHSFSVLPSHFKQVWNYLKEFFFFLTLKSVLMYGGARGAQKYNFVTKL